MTYPHVFENQGEIAYNSLSEASAIHDYEDSRNHLFLPWDIGRRRGREVTDRLAEVETPPNSILAVFEPGAVEDEPVIGHLLVFDSEETAMMARLCFPELLKTSNELRESGLEEVDLDAMANWTAEDLKGLYES